VQVQAIFKKNAQFVNCALPATKLYLNVSSPYRLSSSLSSWTTDGAAPTQDFQRYCSAPAKIGGDKRQFHFSQTRGFHESNRLTHRFKVAGFFGPTRPPIGGLDIQARRDISQERFHNTVLHSYDKCATRFVQSFERLTLAEANLGCLSVLVQKPV
jgi:hypothetical protein